MTKIPLLFWFSTVPWFAQQRHFANRDDGSHFSFRTRNNSKYVFVIFYGIMIWLACYISKSYRCISINTYYIKKGKKKGWRTTTRYILKVCRTKILWTLFQKNLSRFFSRVEKNVAESPRRLCSNEKRLKNI